MAGFYDDSITFPASMNFLTGWITPKFSVMTLKHGI